MYEVADGVKKVCDATLLEPKGMKVMCTDKEQWKKFVNGPNCDTIV